MITTYSRNALDVGTLISLCDDFLLIVNVKDHTQERSIPVMNERPMLGHSPEGIRLNLVKPLKTNSYGSISGETSPLAPNRGRKKGVNMEHLQFPK